MTDHRSVFFACKAGHDPVQVSGKTAHARLPWVAQGFEVFEWVIETRGAQSWVVQTVEERDALYRFHGLDFYARNYVLNWATITRAQVERSLWRQIREGEEIWAGLDQARALLAAKQDVAP